MSIPRRATAHFLEFHCVGAWDPDISINKSFKLYFSCAHHRKYSASENIFETSCWTANSLGESIYFWLLHWNVICIALCYLEFACLMCFFRQLDLKILKAENTFYNFSLQSVLFMAGKINLYHFTF